jgi:hypothetical protein
MMGVLYVIALDLDLHSTACPSQKSDNMLIFCTLMSAHFSLYLSRPLHFFG